MTSCLLEQPTRSVSSGAGDTHDGTVTAAYPRMGAVDVRTALLPSRWGVRGRSAAAALLVVAVALAVAAGALLWVLQRTLESAADDAAAARTQQLSTRLQSASPLELDPTLLVTDGRITAVQVVDAQGRVQRGSDGASTPLTEVRPTPGPPLRLGVQPSRGDNADQRLVAQSVQGARGSYTVIVASAQEPIEITLATVAVLLALGMPVIVVLVGVATFVLVGRSLRPVERIRTRVAAISSADLSERVPVPRADDEITRLARTMNAMLTRVEAGQAAQRRFVGDASHELRSPLATVAAALELALEHPDVLDRDLVSDTLLPEAQRMQRLVVDLLLLASADERGLPLRLTEVDLDDVVDTEARRLPATDHVRVVVRVHPAKVRGDAAQLSRVVRNLAENAARHARTTVWLSCVAEGPTVQLVVSDDGPGIPAAQRGRVFERFVRLEADRGRGSGGSGLGLAIVAEIVAAHGGTIEACSAQGGGARMVVRLPVEQRARPPARARR